MFSKNAVVVFVLLVSCCYGLQPAKLRFSTRKTSAQGIQEAKAQVLEWIEGGAFTYDKCEKKTAGSTKVVCQLKGYLDVGLAVCLTGSGEEVACNIKTEIADLGKLVAGGVTVIPYEAAYISTLPRYDGADGTTLGYFLKFMSGGTMLKPKIWDKFPGSCDHNQLIYAKAKEYAALEDKAKFNTLKADFNALTKFYKTKFRRIKDFQGMLEDSTGHFYTLDPAALPVITDDLADGQWKCVYGDGDDETCTIFGKLGVEDPIAHIQF